MIIATLWLATMAPRIVQTLTAPKFKTNINDQVPYTALAQLLDRGLSLAFIGTCVLVVLRRARDLPTRGSSLAMVLGAPWGYLVLRDMFDGRAPRISTLVYAFVIIGVWAARPRLHDLRLLGGLTVLTAALSMVMAVLLPAKGLYQAAGGSLVEADKQILPWGILIGPVSSGNNLGQLLVMGVPAVLLLRSRFLRLSGLAVTSLAIVWSASRSSLGALAVMLVLWVLLLGREALLRRVVALGSLTAMAVVMAGLPLSTSTDGEFTNRGYIWRLSLEAWQTNPVFGLGSHWYSEVALLANNIAGAAFHGHNEAVQLAVTGGAVLLLLMAVLTAIVTLVAAQWAARGWAYPTLQVATILVSCTLEVSYGLVDRDLFFPVTVLPLAFILMAQDRRARATSTRLSAATSVRASYASTAGSPATLTV